MRGLIGNNAMIATQKPVSTTLEKNLEHLYNNSVNILNQIREVLIAPESSSDYESSDNLKIVDHINTLQKNIDVQLLPINTFIQRADAFLASIRETNELRKRVLHSVPNITWIADSFGDVRRLFSPVGSALSNLKVGQIEIRTLIEQMPNTENVNSVNIQNRDYLRTQFERVIRHLDDHSSKMALIIGASDGRKKFLLNNLPNITTVLNGFNNIETQINNVYDTIRNGSLLSQQHTSVSILEGVVKSIKHDLDKLNEGVTSLQIEYQKIEYRWRIPSTRIEKTRRGQ